MTNAEKYSEVFGMPIDTSNCPTSDCKLCPCANIKELSSGIYIACRSSLVDEWWNKEYKENKK